MAEKQIFMCTASDMHPYNCDTAFGGSCEHCEKKIYKGHNPAKCVLCNFFNCEDCGSDDCDGKCKEDTESWEKK